MPLPPAAPTSSAPTPSLDGAASTSSSAWDRISTWVSEHKAVVYTVAGIAVVATGAGAVYYISRSGASGAKKRPSKKDRRRAKKEREAAEQSSSGPATPTSSTSGRTQATVENATEDLPLIDESTVGTFSDEERKTFANKLKAAGNTAYGDKRYNDAIQLYNKAILCKPDPIYYSNRAACHNALGEYQKCVEDTTAALAMDGEYIKALNRRASAYESLKKYSEALIDYTASCIIDGFRNETAAQSVERLLKKVAEAKAEVRFEGKERRLPNATFITHYLDSFRPKDLPAELDETAELDEESGKGQLRAGFLALRTKSADGYAVALQAFNKAIEAGNLGELEGLAHQWRGTFRFLLGFNTDALADLTKSIELQDKPIEALIKRASVHIEVGDKDAATKDLEQALEQDQDNPDVYYHRGQLDFLLNDFAAAAKGYQRSIDLDRDFVYSHIQLGVTQYKMGSTASSMATFRRCIKNFDKTMEVYNYYGELLLDQQKYNEAIERFDTAIDVEKQSKPTGMNVLPLVNKALAVFQSKQDLREAEKLCQKALIIDPESEVAVATMAQLLLQQGRTTDALEYFEKSAELARSEAEMVNALSYAEATRTQLEVQMKYPQLASRLQAMGSAMGGGPVMR